MQKHEGLPVAGYQAQTAENVLEVNKNKDLEERLLRRIEQLAARPGIDQRWLAIGRTQLEQAFMAINRAVFRPARVRLAEDPEQAPQQDAAGPRA